MIFGQLYSKKSKKLLSLCVSTSGYYSYNTRINGKNKLFRIHRLVAQTFIPNLENKPFVNHKDGDKLNNKVENLEWVTPSENTKHAYKNNLINRDNHLESVKKLRKLSESDVRDIKNKYSKDYSCRKLAKEYNVSVSTINRIILNQTYKAVKDS